MYCEDCDKEFSEPEQQIWTYCPFCSEALTDSPEEEDDDA